MSKNASNHNVLFEEAPSYGLENVDLKQTNSNTKSVVTAKDETYSQNKTTISVGNSMEIEGLDTSMSIVTDVWTARSQVTDTLTARAIDLSLNDKPPEEDCFLCDNYLHKLLNEVKSDWFSVFILIGIPFGKIEACLFKRTEQQRFRRELLQLFIEWRDGKAHYEHKGIPVLLSALRKSGLWAVGLLVQTSLKQWHDCAALPSDPLHFWLTRAYKECDTLVPGDYPPPMSDQFLVMLVSYISPTVKLSDALAITPLQLQDLKHKKLYFTNVLKAFKMLTLFRNQDTHTSKIEKIDSLLSVLGKLRMTDAKRIASTTIKCWLKKSLFIDERERSELLKILFRHDPMGSRSMTMIKNQDNRMSIRNALHVLRPNSHNSSSSQDIDIEPRDLFRPERSKTFFK